MTQDRFAYRTGSGAQIYITLEVTGRGTKHTKRQLAVAGELRTRRVKACDGTGTFFFPGKMARGIQEQQQLRHLQPASYPKRVHTLKR